jgi:phage terminase large subunit-like protein
MNALVLIFPPSYEGEQIWIKPYFWIPQSTIDRKSEIGNFKQWQRDGFINSSGVDVVNQKEILRDIFQVCTQYQVKAIAFDRFMAYNGIIQGLQEEEVECFEFGQGLYLCRNLQKSWKF